MLDIGVQGPRPRRLRVRRSRARAARRRRRCASSRVAQRAARGHERRRDPRAHAASTAGSCTASRRSSTMHARAASGRRGARRRATLREAKQLGFSDQAIDRLTGSAARRDRARCAHAARHPPAPRADRHAGRRVPGRDQLPLLDLPRDRRPTWPPIARARRSWCSARAPTASARASSSTGAA